MQSPYPLSETTASEVEMGSRLRAETFSPLSPAGAPVVLAWKDLVVKVKKGGKEKNLLNNISGSITGGFWAIMGASGGGKTTLLSTLSLRLNVPGMHISGSITLNGRPYNKETLKTVSAYVMQDDLLHPDLTVEQTLVCTSRLRLPKISTKSDIKERVDTVISLMGIGHCRHVVVGDTRRKGISGGERKRLCIAMELLSQPSLLFLDEPTSGLDSSTALSVCSFLKDIADKAICTVVCTIHQPQTKIFNLFDNLILMKNGGIVYQGGSRKSLLFFEAAGFPCPSDVNPADHLLDILTTQLENEGQVRVPDNQVVIDIQQGSEKPEFAARDVQTWPKQVSILLQRNAQQTLRRYDILVMNIFVSIILALFISLSVWRNIGFDQKSIALRRPALFFLCSLSRDRCLFTKHPFFSFGTSTYATRKSRWNVQCICLLFCKNSFRFFLPAYSNSYLHHHCLSYHWIPQGCSPFFYVHAIHDTGHISSYFSRCVYVLHLYFS